MLKAKNVIAQSGAAYFIKIDRDHLQQEKFLVNGSSTLRMSKEENGKKKKKEKKSAK